VGTRWECHENTLGTNKNPTPHLSPREGKCGAHGCMLTHLIGYQIFLFAYLCSLPFWAYTNWQGHEPWVYRFRQGG